MDAVGWSIAAGLVVVGGLIGMFWHEGDRAEGFVAGAAVGLALLGVMWFAMEWSGSDDEVCYGQVDRTTECVPVEEFEPYLP